MRQFSFRRLVLSVGLAVALLATGLALWKLRPPPDTLAGVTDRVYRLTLADAAVGRRLEAQPGSVLIPQPQPVASAPSELSERKRQQFLGAQACAECHPALFETCRATSHFLTSSWPGEDWPQERFTPPHSRFDTSDPSLWFEMRKAGSQYTQALLVDRQGQHEFAAEIALVTGSGKAGQTYAWRLGDQLFELPVSFETTTNQWVYSPGYVEGTANFARPILPRCLECHATYAAAVPKSLNQFPESSCLLGITCEKCHGPGRAHVEQHHLDPDTDSGREIVHVTDLSAERKNDLCALCHSGVGISVRSPFNYQPGEPLDEYVRYDPAPPTGNGVHTANQLVRLKESRCFQNSPGMTCLDCHNPHVNERDQTMVFNQRCLHCHQAQHCPEVAADARLSGRCVDCHMPRRQVGGGLRTKTDVIPQWMRDHRIAVWPEALDAVRGSAAP